MIGGEENDALMSRVAEMQRKAQRKEAELMLLTNLLAAIHVHPDLNSPKEIYEAVKLILSAEDLSSAEADTLIAAFRNGPLWDGDVPSKSGRDSLVQKGYLTRVIVKAASGYNACTYKGADVYRLRMALTAMREA